MSPFNCPLSTQKADQLIALLGLTERSRLLDAGCGSGAFLVRAVEASACAGVGIDLDENAIARAREAARNIQRGSAEFRAGDARHAAAADAPFDAAACIGSTHAFGVGAQAFPDALAALRRHLRPGALMLVAETYWKQPPAPDYLRFLGDPPGVYRGHAENIELADALGLRPVHAAVSNDDEWDHFEWSHHRRAIERASALPDPAKAAEAIGRATAWRNAYLRWGRTTMGFGFYLFRTPGAAV